MSNKSTNFLAILGCLTWWLATAQAQPKSLYPQLGLVPDLSEAAQQKFARILALNEKEAQEQTLSKLEEAERDYLINELDGMYDETKEHLWDVQGGGCSWYCGVNEMSIKASSYLPLHAGNTYEPGNAHDFDFRTAWVEGAPGGGVGQYIEYKFLDLSARINQINIFNGYVKSDKAWQENARAKTLELSVNGKPYAILHLQDTKAEQRFAVAPIGYHPRSGDLTLRFKVLAVFPGSKYEDLAITEIYFDGLDVHCLAQGTPVALANGRQLPIEQVAVGDTVLTYDERAQGLCPAVVEQLAQARHRHLVRYEFDNGLHLTATPDHPLLRAGEGWGSLQPEQSAQYVGLGQVGCLALGNDLVVAGPSGPTRARLVRITTLEQWQTTYTIAKLSAGNSFIASGLVVGTEELAGQ
jgi:hypothetical protein